MKFRLTSDLDPGTVSAIDALVASAPNAHFTQLPGWTAVPEDPSARRLILVGEQEDRAAASGIIRLRRIPLFGWTTADVFRGPTALSPASLHEWLVGLHDRLAPMRPIVIRIDPYWTGEGSAELARFLADLGYAPSVDPHWHLRSLEIPIDKSAEELIASFKPAARRQVRKAIRAEIDVRVDLDDDGLRAFQTLYDEMARTKGASPRSPAFFRGLRDLFRSWPHRGFFLSSWDGNDMLGGISVFTLGRRAIYAFGATSQGRPDIPKSHLLHFTAMQRARDLGCDVYDMGGYSSGVGEDGSRSAAQSINYFKSGFGGTEVEFVGGHERIVHPKAWRLVLAANRLFR